MKVSPEGLIKNLTATKLKWIWNKYTNSETMKITYSCGVHKTIYYNGSYYLLLERFCKIKKIKIKNKNLKFYMSNSSFIEITTSLYKVLPSNKHCTL